MATATEPAPLTAVGERRVESIDWLRGLIMQLRTEGMDAHRAELAHYHLDRLAGPIGGAR